MWRVNEKWTRHMWRIHRVTRSLVPKCIVPLFPISTRNLHMSPAFRILQNTPSRGLYQKQTARPHDRTD